MWSEQLYHDGLRMIEVYNKQVKNCWKDEWRAFDLEASSVHPAKSKHTTTDVKKFGVVIPVGNKTVCLWCAILLNFGTPAFTPINIISKK